MSGITSFPVCRLLKGPPFTSKVKAPTFTPPTEETNTTMPANSITHLHNYLQGRHEEHLLSYEESSTGPSNKAVWKVICKFKGEEKGVGTGATIAEAKQVASQQALTALRAAE